MDTSQLTVSPTTHPANVATAAPPKVSIILPVFKARDYIAEAIASLQRQTLRELEFIFIDDLGNDGTADIIEQAARSDSRIHLLRNPVNSGAGPSRNLGLANARGEYVAFMDADDWVDDNFYERLYGLAHPAHLDFAKGVRILHEEDGTITPSKLNDRIRKASNAGRPIYKLFTFEHQAAIFSQAFLQASGAAYGTSHQGEDTTFLLRALYAAPDAPAPTFALADDVAYHYRQLSTSLIHFVTDSFFSELVKSIREKHEFLAPFAARDPAVYGYAAKKVDILIRRHYPKIQTDPARAACRVDFLADLLEAIHILPDPEKIAHHPALRQFLPLLSIPWPLSDSDRSALSELMDACFQPHAPCPTSRRRFFRRLASKFLRLFQAARHR